MSCHKGWAPYVDAGNVVRVGGCPDWLDRCQGFSGVSVRVLMNFCSSSIGLM